MRERVTHVGFAAGRFGQQGDLDALDRRVGELIETGATICELFAGALDAVAACRLVPDRIKAVQTVLRRHDIRYTLHAPIAVNLMDEPHIEHHERAARASLELAAACAAGVVVFHPGRTHPSAWVDASARLLGMERDLLRRLGDQAQKLGVKIAYENMSPNRRIIAGTETSYALDLAALADQLEAVDHPAVMACLDVSHAQQGALLRRFDLIEQARLLAPHVGHLHFSDSIGVPATILWENEGECLFFGVGDMHAPPGFGDIDFERLADVMTIRDGTAIAIELQPNHYAHSGKATLEAAKGFARRINGVNV